MSSTAARLEWLADYRFTGDVDGYPEGELYFPGSPILTVSGTFADAVMLETLALSILNHDSAIASAAARMVTAAAGRPLIEMGSRRTHEAGGGRGGAGGVPRRASRPRPTWRPSAATASRRRARPRTPSRCLHDDEQVAFATQVTALGPETTLLVDTYDITPRHRAGRARGRDRARRGAHRLR